MGEGAEGTGHGTPARGGSNGTADVRRRAERPSELGGGSYEPYATKLSRATRAGTILQLCVYSDRLTQLQGIEPEYMYVVTPEAEFRPQAYRFQDYAAYYRLVRARLDQWVEDL